MADFDGDGLSDLLSGSNCCGFRTLHLFRRKSDGSWLSREDLDVKYPNVRFGLQATTFPSSADWNGDGISDVVHVILGHPIRIAYGPLRNGESVVLANVGDILPKTRGRQIVATDWTGDGKLDLLALQGIRRDESVISLFENIGTLEEPRFSEGEILVSRRSAGKRISEESNPADDPLKGICVGDWNSDGQLDLVVTRSVARPRNGLGQDGKRRWLRRGTVWVYLHD